MRSRPISPRILVQRRSTASKKATTLHWCWTCVLRSLPLRSLKPCTPRSPRCFWARTERRWPIRCAVAGLLLHLHGHQDGDRWRAARAWHHAPVPHCQHGKPCHPPVRCPDLCTALWYCLCLACRPGRVAGKLSGLLCGAQKIVADGKCSGTSMILCSANGWWPAGKSSRGFSVWWSIPDGHRTAA